MGVKGKGSIGAGRFALGERLGEGSFGEVYKTLDEDQGEEVVLKTLRYLDDDALRQFRREFRELASITHPNLATLHELIVEGERWYFTMEYVDGADFLTSVSRADDGSREDLREKRLRQTLRQLCEGLMALHQAGKSHMNIKPSNVLVADDGTVKLVDYGLVAESSMSASESHSTRQRAEESDWFDVGVMLYQALTGQHPYRGEQGSDEEPKPTEVRELNPKAPQDLSSLAWTLVSHDGAKRPSGENILEVLAHKRKKASKRASSTSVVSAPKTVVVRAPEAATPKSEPDADDDERSTLRHEEELAGPVGVEDGQKTVVDRARDRLGAVLGAIARRSPQPGPIRHAVETVRKIIKEE